MGAGATTTGETAPCQRSTKKEIIVYLLRSREVLENGDGDCLSDFRPGSRSLRSGTDLRQSRPLPIPRSQKIVRSICGFGKRLRGLRTKTRLAAHATRQNKSGASKENPQPRPRPALT